MKKLILIALIAPGFTTHAQIYRERIGFDLESIADIDIGWMEIRKHTVAAKGKQVADRIYSARQIDNCQKFVEWMQQSYLPKGCLGNATYYQNYIPKFNSSNSLLGNAINMHAQALPLMYGAQTKIHMFLKKDGKGNFVPQTSHGEFWHIEANAVRNISEPVSFISSNDEYYFIITDFKSDPKGYSPDDKARSNLLGFENHPNIKAYRHFLIGPQSGIENPQFVVIMSKNNELPFEKITIGEFFIQAEKQFPFWQKTNPVTPEKYSIAQKNLSRLKEKYKKKWNDIAELDIAGAGIDLYDFINATEEGDMFDQKDMYGKEVVRTTFPVLKVTKATRELCKTDQPQWIVVRWTWGMENQRYYLHLHESILNNFNFEYLYNYFFNPEKVKDQAYKPIRSPFAKDVVVKNEVSEKARKIKADNHVLFFEDFSTTSPGKKPTGWQAKFANSGTTGLVTNPDGLEGNWVELRGHYIGSALFDKPLPLNFTLSYDLVASENFTWGSKGLTMLLSKETSPGNAESFIRLKLRPGSNGSNGEAELETKFPASPGYVNGTRWYVANGFSNNKKINRIAVSIKKSDETLQVFIDGNKIAEHKKSIPPSHLLNRLSFDCAGNSAENDKYFISNIKIVKE